MFGELKETPFEHFVTHYGQVIVVDVSSIELGELRMEKVLFDQLLLPEETSLI